MVLVLLYWFVTTSPYISYRVSRKHTHGPAAHFSATEMAPLALEATLFPVALTVAVVPLARLFAVYFTDTTESHPVEKVATILKDCDARWT